LNNGSSLYRPLVFVISAPSGSGKSTLVGRLLEAVPNLVFSVSYTTRERRGHEQPGVDYNYISREDFESRIARDEFLECASVFGNYYGTHGSVLDKAAREGKDVVLDIDVKGARQLKVKLPDAIGIFILAPSRHELEQRLRARSEDSQLVIDRRLREAAEEIRNYDRYEYVVVNREVDESATALAAIVLAERARRVRMDAQVRPILATFENVTIETERSEV
jgi:guanylate kinase